jgi:UDP-2,3-diacylglucosamine pyrophosphatase LpxH
VVAELLARARRGVRIVYVPGNHDEYVRKFAGLTVGGIEVALTVIHETADGRRYLVLHGDQFDRVVQRLPLVALFGNWAYRASLLVNRVAGPRCRFGLYCRAISIRAKLAIRAVTDSFSHSEQSLVGEAVRHGVDGIICGHTHQAADSSLHGIHYVNTGDWVESFTGVVEDLDGRLAIARWVPLAHSEKAGHPILQPGGDRPLEGREAELAA